jgi:hypothetical protein
MVALSHAAAPEWGHHSQSYSGKPSEFRDLRHSSYAAAAIPSNFVWFSHTEFPRCQATPSSTRPCLKAAGKKKDVSTELCP